MPKITPHNSRMVSKKSSSVIDRIKPIGFRDDEGIKMVVYGNSGTGKTTLWATFPKPILAVICSGRNNPGELRSVDIPEYDGHIFQVVLKQSEELSELIEYVKGGTYATLVLDHVSGLEDMVLKEILGLEEIPAQKSWGLATQQEYGECTVKMKTFLRNLLQFEGNVVLVAHQREFNPRDDDETLAPFVCANLMPKLASWLNGTMDYICQTFIRNKEVQQKIKLNNKVKIKTVKTKDVEFCLRTGRDAVYATKFRVPKGVELPYVLVDPTYQMIHDLVRASRQR